MRLTLLWLRVYPTLEVLGFLFGLDKTNAEDNLKGVLATLDGMTSFAYDRPAKDRPKMRSLAAVMDAFPDVCLIIDAKATNLREQCIRRPGGEDENGGSRQKPFYSGKKKAHTTPIKPLKDAGGRGPTGAVPGRER